MSERKHPQCHKCGWRMGGVDSWNGRACKCGHYEPPFPADPSLNAAANMGWPVPTKERQ